jgi:hypothetical protein
MQPASSNYLKGAVFGFATVSIWASWSAITRLAVTTSLDACDIAALSFGVAGLPLSPVLMQRGLARNRLGWLGLAVLIAGAGAPYALVAAGGLHFAPAREQGALNPGFMPLFVSSGSGRTKQIGSPSSSSPPVSIWQAEARCRAARRERAIRSYRSRAMPRSLPCPANG